MEITNWFRPKKQIQNKIEIDELIGYVTSVGLPVVCVYGLYQICCYVLNLINFLSYVLNLIKFPPTTKHVIFGNPIHVIRDQQHYQWAIRKLSKELKSAKNAFLGFACERHGDGRFTELQLASPNGICVMVNLQVMGVPKELRDLLARSTIVSADATKGVRILEEMYDTTVRNTIDLRCLSEPSFSLRAQASRELRVDINTITCKTEELNIQRKSAYVIGAARTMESYLNRGLYCDRIADINHVLPGTFAPDAIHDVSERPIHIVSDWDHCRWVVQELREQSSQVYGYYYIGFNCGWDQRNSAALLQLVSSARGTRGICALFKLYELKRYTSCIPAELRSLLNDPRVLKVGANPFRDAKLLEQNYNAHVRGVVDLHHFQSVSPNEVTTIQQQILVELLDQRKHDSLSSRELKNLTDEQIQLVFNNAITEAGLFISCVHSEYDSITAFRSIVDKEYERTFLPLTYHFEFHNPIHVVVDEQHCRWVVRKLRTEALSIDGFSYLGFHCEWVEPNPVALLQLASSAPGGICALIRLCMMTIPTELQSLLNDPKVLKVGVDAVHDAKLLEQHYNVHVQGVVTSVKENYDDVTDWEQENHDDVTDWEQENLADDQIQYAASVAIAVANQQYLPFTFHSMFRNPIHVVEDEHHCRWVVRKLRTEALSFNGFSYLGFDCEWVEPNPVALLQLASSAPGGICALIRLCVMTVPTELQSLLNDPKVLKVGVDPFRDAKRLEQHYNVHVRGVVELRHFRPKPPHNLAVLTEQVLKIPSRKGKYDGVTDWEQENLADDQIQYAAGDAIAGAKIFQIVCDENIITLELIVDEIYKQMRQTTRNSHSIYIITSQHQCEWNVSELRKTKYPFIGFASERHNGRLALLQLCNLEGHCALIRLCETSISDSLRVLFEDEKILKVGIEPDHGLKLLEQYHKVKMRGTIDVRHCYSIVTPSIAQHYLDRTDLKASWERKVLSEAQIQYAAGECITAANACKQFMNIYNLGTLKKLVGKQFQTKLDLDRHEFAMTAESRMSPHAASIRPLQLETAPISDRVWVDLESCSKVKAAKKAASKRRKRRAAQRKQQGGEACRDPRQSGAADAGSRPAAGTSGAVPSNPGGAANANRR